MNIAVTFPENPFSTTSGAARSVRTICEILASGPQNEVAAYGFLDEDPTRTAEHLTSQLGISVGIFPSGIKFRYRNVSYVFRLGIRPIPAWHWGGGIDILFGYGGDPATLKWFESAQSTGLRTIFALRNYGYQGAGGHTSFKCMSDFLTPSEFLSNYYAKRIEYLGPKATALPMPINFEDCVLPIGQGGKFGGPVVMVNPSPEKGLMFMARLWQRLQTERGDIPLRIVLGRADIDVFRAACVSAGFNPYTSGYPHSRPYPQVEILGPEATPKDIYRGAGCVLMPSLWDEPAGRVAVEAMLNGVPVIHSGRGGLDEATCDVDGEPCAIWEGIDPSITSAQMSPVSASYTNGWFQTICSLYRTTYITHPDKSWDYYSNCQHNAAMSVYGSDSNLAHRYLAFFEKGKS